MRAHYCLCSSCEHAQYANNRTARVQAVDELRLECAALDGAGRRRTGASVAWSIQRYLIFALLSCIPGRRMLPCLCYVCGMAITDARASSVSAQSVAPRQVRKPASFQQRCKSQYVRGKCFPIRVHQHAGYVTICSPEGLLLMAALCTAERLARM